MANEDVVPTDAVPSEEDVIRGQMEVTRTALTEKLETLENKVTETVTGATTAVTDTVEAVKESVQNTVDTVNQTVQDTIASVKDSVNEGVEGVRSAFDVSGHVQRHPWAMLAGSIAVGFCLAQLLAPRPRRKAARQPEPPAPAPVPPNLLSGNGRPAEAQKPQAPGLLASFGPEIDKLKGMAISAVMGTVHEMIVNAAPDSLRSQVTEIVDGFTEKLGGTPMHHSDSSERPPAYASPPKPAYGGDPSRKAHAL